MEQQKEHLPSKEKPSRKIVIQKLNKISHLHPDDHLLNNNCNCIAD